MRIGLIYEKFVQGGGLENYLFELATRLRARGHALEVVTSAISPETSGLDARFHLLARPRWSATARLWRFAAETEGVRRQLAVDVTVGFGRTFAHDIHRAGGGCHRVYSALLPWHKRWGLKNQLELHLERELYQGNRTRWFVVNSHQVATQLATHYRVPQQRVRVIHTAVDTRRYRPLTTRERQQAWRDLKEEAGPDREIGRRPVFVFVSLSHGRKGLKALLQAWSGVDAELWIAGAPLGRWRRQVRRLGLQDRVIDWGRRSDLERLFGVADWFVHPTLYDACANAVLQSMACGLPGLISTCDGAIDHLEHGRNGLLITDPRDPGSVRAAINEALAMPKAVRDAMGKDARQTMQPLTWDKHVDEWDALLAHAAAEKQSAPPG